MTVAENNAALNTSDLLAGAQSLYSASKEAVVKTLPSLESSIDLVEGKVVETYNAHVDAEAQAKALNKVDEYVVAPVAAAAVKTQERVTSIVSDVNAKVESTKAATAAYADKQVTRVLDAAESAVALLPAVEGEEEEEEAAAEGEEEATLVAKTRTRVASLSKTASKRLVARLSTVSLRESPLLTKYTVDLIAVNDLLDVEAVKGYVQTNAAAAQEFTAEKFETVNSFVVTRYSEAKTQVAEGVASLDAKYKISEQVGATVSKVDAQYQVTARVDAYAVQPAKQYYALATAEFAKLSTKTNAETGEPEGVSAAEFTANVRARLGAAWSEQLLPVTEGLLETLKAEWATVAAADEKLKAEDATRAARLEAFVNAVGLRLRATWEKARGEKAAAAEE